MHVRPHTWSCCVGTDCAARVVTRAQQRLLASHVAPLTMYCCARCSAMPHHFLISALSLLPCFQHSNNTRPHHVQGCASSRWFRVSATASALFCPGLAAPSWTSSATRSRLATSRTLLPASACTMSAAASVAPSASAGGAAGSDAGRRRGPLLVRQQDNAVVHPEELREELQDVLQTLAIPFELGGKQSPRTA